MEPSVPKQCAVLVVGGGPAGSYAAAVLARENIDVVILEAATHPRYHIGESLLPSMRHFLKFIDLYDSFNDHGFLKKNGAAFRLNISQPEAYTDFIAAGGPGSHAWNVVRSEADELLFRHAEASGALAFDSTKVTSIQFEDALEGSVEEKGGKNLKLGRPVSASWTRADSTSGTISFNYLVDASGRRGILSTTYLKNRKFNQNLKNIANWGYWKGAAAYGVGTHKEGSPYFEALHDASGWCWFIPLHNGRHSIGIVQNQQAAKVKKAAMKPSLTVKDFYLESLNRAPRIKALLGEAELVSDVSSASDWSYQAPEYAFPYARIAGDAGCFIDPFFSSGVHLAVVGGLSAAVTIVASLRGHCDEGAAASWHSKKVAESYTRFFLVVSSAMKQIWAQDDPVIQDVDEVGFQKAFNKFQPVIQGTVDADHGGKLTQSEISSLVEFCFKAFSEAPEEKVSLVMGKLKSMKTNLAEPTTTEIQELTEILSQEEMYILDIIRSRSMIRAQHFTLDSFAVDAIDGLAPNLVRGSLGLKRCG